MLNRTIKKGGVNVENSHKTFVNLAVAQINNYIGKNIFYLEKYSQPKNGVKHLYKNAGILSGSFVLNNDSYVMCKNKINASTKVDSKIIPKYDVYNINCIYIEKI